MGGGEEEGLSVLSTEMGFLSRGEILVGGKSFTLNSEYFSEFPNRTNTYDVFQLFGWYGEIVEVAIFPRNNKIGKRFGFARFREVEDAKLLDVSILIIF